MNNHETILHFIIGALCDSCGTVQISIWCPSSALTQQRIRIAPNRDIDKATAEPTRLTKWTHIRLPLKSHGAKKAELKNDMEQEKTLLEPTDTAAQYRLSSLQFPAVVAMARQPFYIHSVTSHAVHFSHVNIKYHTRWLGSYFFVFFLNFISTLLFILFGFTRVANFSPFAAQPLLGGWTCADHVPIPHVKHVHKVMVALARIDEGILYIYIIKVYYNMNHSVHGGPSHRVHVKSAF